MSAGRLEVFSIDVFTALVWEGVQILRWRVRPRTRARAGQADRAAKGSIG